MGTVRVLLAIGVVLSHTPYNSVFVSAHAAVEIFYMISGFLISFVLAENPAYKNVWTFYRNRFLRLYPAYFVVAVVTLAVTLAFTSRWHGIETLPKPDQAFLAATNIALFGQDWTHFIGTAKYLIVPQAWTLGLELTFYLVAPFIVRRTGLLTAILVVSISLRIIWRDATTYDFFPYEISLFVLGIFSHRLILEPAKALAMTYPRLPLLVCIIAAIFCCTGTMAFGVGNITLLPIYAATWFALPFLFLFQNASRIDRAAGDYSYPIYIGHVFILGIAIALARTGWLPTLDSPAWVALVIVGSLAFAALLKIVVIDPIETIRRN